MNKYKYWKRYNNKTLVAECRFCFNHYDLNNIKKLLFFYMRIYLHFVKKDVIKLLTEISQFLIFFALAFKKCLNYLFAIIRLFAASFFEKCVIGWDDFTTHFFLENEHYYQQKLFCISFKNIFDTLFFR